MDKPSVHVKVGTAFEQLASDALDVLIERGNYSDAIQLNSQILDAPSIEAAMQNILAYVDLHID
jgi:hypothetical protein